MSGAVGTPAENTKRKRKYGCGVCKGYFSVNLWDRNPSGQLLNINNANTECLELSGRLLRIQKSKRILAVVYVRGIFV